MSNQQQPQSPPTTTTTTTTVAQTDTNWFRLKFWLALGGRTKFGQWSFKIDVQTGYNLNEPAFRNNLILPMAEAFRPLLLQPVNLMRCVATTAQKGDSVKPYNPANIRRVNLTGTGSRGMDNSEMASLDNCLQIGLDTVTGRQAAIFLRGALTEADITSVGTGMPSLTGNVLLPQHMEGFNNFLTTNVQNFRLGSFYEEGEVGGNRLMFFRESEGASIVGVSQKPLHIDRVSDSVRLKNARAVVAKLTAATTP